MQLQAQFDAARLPAIILKGAPLGILAYGTVSIKEQWDIDLLTTVESVLAARRLLLDLGYAQLEPAGLDEAQFLNFTRLAKEAIFVRPGAQSVELHWRLVDGGESLRSADPFVDCRTVPIGSGQVRTLGDWLHLPYLASHGQCHGWSRLKWIADVNGYIAHHTNRRFDDMIENARSLGAHRSVEAAILLCHDLFSLEVDDARLERIRTKAAIKTLHWINRQSVAQPAGGSDLPTYSLATMMIIASKLVIAPNWRGRSEVIASYWIRPVEFARGKQGFRLGYSLTRLMGMLVRLPYRIVRDRIKFRQAMLAVKKD